VSTEFWTPPPPGSLEGHMCPCVFVNLPTALSRLVLTEWVSVKHVTRLDSALCSHESREQFLSVTSGTVFTTLNSNLVNQKEKLRSILRWSHTRKSAV
jgi:hypothetical protein